MQCGLVTPKHKIFSKGDGTGRRKKKKKSSQKGPCQFPKKEGPRTVLRGVWLQGKIYQFTFLTKVIVNFRGSDLIPIIPFKMEGQVTGQMS